MAFDQPTSGAHDESHERRALNRGYTDGMSRAFELVLTPAILAGFGWLLDRWFDLFPVLTITFAVLGVVGVFVKVYLGYEAEMQVHEAERKARADARKRDVSEAEA